MKEYICSTCKKPADLKKVNQLNTITLTCKECAIKELNAQLTNNDKVNCDTCNNKSKYITLSQLNRIKNYCEDCLLKEYKSI
ncbi:hypothetical protein [Spiroplasma endosymbiont of Diplazon laetatorius]|uniref:hypothetical protein n=1 Tax=Spiroplasma endosymbiont of Diplazon laetatorius TaxID=3066322 RepID=UPI0030CB9BFA